MPKLAWPLFAVLLAILVVSSSFTVNTGGQIQRRDHQSNHPVIGVHTRLTDEVEEWKIRRSFEMVREMGATWVVEYFPWTYIETAKGRFDWTHADLVVNLAYEQGLTIIARVDNVPLWARPAGTSDRYADANVAREYGDFLAAFARRYQDKIQHFVIWNEPNVSAEWGFRPVDPVGYTELLKVAYQGVKEAHPSALVLPAAMAPTVEQTADALDDLIYWQKMYDAGAKQYFDIMNIHSYGWRNPPDDPASPGKVNFARAQLVHDVMVRNGDSEKKAIITEAGWNDHPRWTKAVRPAQRVEYSVRAIQKVEREWPWVIGLCFWNFRLPFPARNYNDQYALVDQEFRPKPVYEAIRSYANN